MATQYKSSKLPENEKLALIAMLEYVRVAVEYSDPLADGLIQMVIAHMYEGVSNQSTKIIERQPCGLQ